MPPNSESLANLNTTGDGQSGFFWTEEDQPHNHRRHAILKKFPEIKDLYGHDPNQKYTVALYVFIQFVMMFAVIPYVNWWWVVFFTYTISGTLNHSLSLAVHELSHNLMFETKFANKVFGMISNFPQGVPSFATFCRYHQDHHRYQGIEGKDTDIPTELECKFFTSPLRKLLFLFLQPLFYAIRPMAVSPKVLSADEIINLIVQLTFDFSVIYFYGFKSFFYILFGTLLGMGIHPVAGHFVAEHYVLTKGYETYSYYGPINKLCFNVGYHNEHHDFPKVPGSRLPLVRKIAAEFYDELPHYDSWVKVMWDFVFRSDVTLYSRVKRVDKAKAQ